MRDWLEPAQLGAWLPVLRGVQSAATHIFWEPKRAQGQSRAFHSYKGLSPKSKF